MILPFTVLRWLDCVLAPTRQAVLDKHAALLGRIQNLDGMLKRASGLSFYNTSRLDFQASVRDQDNVARNLRAYIGGFSPNAQEILESYELIAERLDALITVAVTGKIDVTTARGVTG